MSDAHATHAFVLLINNKITSKFLTQDPKHKSIFV